MEQAQEKYKGQPWMTLFDFKPEDVPIACNSVKGCTLVNNYQNKLLFFTTGAKVEPAWEYVRYHGSKLAAAQKAVKMKGSLYAKLAMGWSYSESKPGLYCSETLSGAMQYMHAGRSDGRVMTVLRTVYAQRVNNSRHNKIINPPEDHVSVGFVVCFTGPDKDQFVMTADLRPLVDPAFHINCSEAYRAYSLKVWRKALATAGVKDPTAVEDVPIEVDMPVQPAVLMEEQAEVVLPVVQEAAQEAFQIAEKAAVVQEAVLSKTDIEDKVELMTAGKSSSSFSPRIARLVDTFTEKLSLQGTGEVIRCLGHLDFKSVRGANLFEDVEELQDEANKLPFKTANVTRKAVINIWQAALSICKQMIRDKANAADTAVLTKPPLPQAPAMMVGCTPKNMAVPSNPFFKKQRLEQVPILKTTGAPLVAAELPVWTKSRDAEIVLWQKLMEAGERSAVFLEFESASKPTQERIKQMRLAEWEQLPIEALRTKISALRRWASFAREAQMDIWQPPAYGFRLYLHAQMERGSSVPKQQMEQLQWCAVQLGLKWTLEMIPAGASVSLPGPLKQATVMPLRVWHKLESTATASKNLYVKLVCAVWALLVLGGVRFAHLQRSKIFGLKAGYAVFLCSMGKSRSGGSRRPFHWTVPLAGLRASFVSIITAAIETAPMAYRHSSSALFWILPDLICQGNDLGTATGFKPTPMKIGKFHALTRNLLERDADEAIRKDAVSLSSYSARRLMPTLADIAKVPPEFRSIFGHWSGNKVIQNMPRHLAMPRRYSEAHGFT